MWGELGKCESAIPYWQAQTRDEETGDQVLDRTKRALVADDGSSYSAALLCRPDFGCVDFEKDTAPADPATTKGTME